MTTKRRSPTVDFGKKAVALVPQKEPSPPADTNTIKQSGFKKLKARNEILKKAKVLIGGEPKFIYKFIALEQKSYPVSLLCELMHVSRSGYYDWQKRKKHIEDDVAYNDLDFHLDLGTQPYEKLAQQIVSTILREKEIKNHYKISCHNVRSVALSKFPPEAQKFLERFTSDKFYKGQPLSVIAPLLKHPPPPYKLTWAILNDTARNMANHGISSKNLGLNDFDNPLILAGNALKLAISELLNRRKNQYDHRSSNKRKANHTWGICYLCWRIIDSSFERTKRSERCELHTCATKSSKEYHKLIRILGRSNIKHTIGLVIPRALAKTMADIKHRTIGVPKSSIESYWPGYFNGLFPPESFTVKPTSHDFSKIWELYPYTAKYILKNGGDLNSAQSILRVLQAYPCDSYLKGKSPTSDNQQFRHLFDCMEKDFGLADGLLLFAETWLQFLSEDKEKHPHGGQRPGAGSKKGKKKNKR